MARNRLADETSPYLLQHADNPVDWYPWGTDALDLARQQDKPILLSIGYAACHWCHVMAHECFENPDIAAQMNRQFVNIKVDREERPDLDTIYQHALALLGQHGGWPLTMFLTPDGEPFWGGTYFPPSPRHGRPGLPQVLDAIVDHYANQKDKVAQSVAALRDALGGLAKSDPGPGLPIDVNDRAAEALLEHFDSRHGGIGTAPKFPNVPMLEMVWRAGRRNNNAAETDAVMLTLTRMSQGGIYDHVGGGYARYATDPEWLVPHFEKMLYDNAQLIDILGHAWRATGDALLARRIEETVDWIAREMIAEGGAFASTLDADSEGVEGKFYVWRAEEIESLLGDDADRFMRVYDVTPGGNWEGTNILNRRFTAALLDDGTEAALAANRQALLTARAHRVRPGWDDKVLADWNGLMIAALARAGATFARPDWIAMARRAFDFIVGSMQTDGRLVHNWRAGRPGHVATLDDYAAMIGAAVALYETTGDAGCLDHTARWIDVLDAHYRDGEGGGYFMTADDAESLIVRTKSADDNATPSGNGMLAAASARLWYLTGDESHRARTEAIIAAFTGQVAKNVLALATLLNAAEFLAGATQIVVVGEKGDDRTKALLDAAWRSPLMDKTIQHVAPGDTLPDAHPAAGKGLADSAPAAYVCRSGTCSLPLTDSSQLVEILA